MLNKLGIIPLAVFMVSYPITNEIEYLVRSWGFVPPRLEQLLPGLHDSALGSFLVYFALYDFAAYWLHRAQHRFAWWWALHSLHHSQRQVTVWSDDRNHIVDDLLITLALVVFAQFVGVQPDDYILILMIGRLIESWSHANVDMSFGRVGERLIVGPRFHRLHHARANPDEPPRPRPQFRAGVPDLGHAVRHGDLRRQAPPDRRRRSADRCRQRPRLGGPAGDGVRPLRAGARAALQPRASSARTSAARGIGVTAP